MNKKYALLFFLGCFLHIRSASAQESMMPEVSYVFLEKLIATAKDNYPRLDVFKARTDIAKSNISKEQLSWLDAFSFTYVYKPENTVDLQNPIIFNGYQAAVSFNLSSLFQKPANVKQAKLEHRIAEYDQQEYNLTIESEVKRRYFSYLQQLNALKLQSKLVSDIQNMSRDIRSKYEKSEISFELYSQSQSSLSAAIQNKIAIESNFLSAKALLEELLTKKIEEVL
ncbi:MAG: TolC family protein [Daejeonella sp.]|uniref:TolC family protein n=1 Tax=Daejeonella sp. JGW-45 TaxID=3034148 RepID=UPI0023ECE84A|nr:TolC family protein [Daejeonella sp. JGW-45]